IPVKALACDLQKGSVGGRVLSLKTGTLVTHDLHDPLSPYDVMSPNRFACRASRPSRSPPLTSTPSRQYYSGQQRLRSTRGTETSGIHWSVRILIVEDDRKMADLLRRGLEEEAHAVALAHTGPDGLAAAQSCGFDAIVLDVMLPGLDGFRVAQRLRAAHNQ